MKKKFIKSYLCFVFLFSKASIAFFGTDAAALAPILSEQLYVLNQGLTVANDTLAELQNLQRGIDKIREMRLGRQDLYALLATHEELVALTTNLHEIDKHMEELSPLEETGIQNIPDLRSARFNRSLTKASLFLAERMKQDTVRQESRLAGDLIDAAMQAESGAEAAKITAEGTGVLIYQNSELMALEAQQLEVLALDLEMQNNSKKETITAQFVELSQLREGLQALPPIR